MKLTQIVVLIGLLMISTGCKKQAKRKKVSDAEKGYETITTLSGKKMVRRSVTSNNPEAKRVLELAKKVTLKGLVKEVPVEGNENLDPEFWLQYVVLQPEKGEIVFLTGQLSLTLKEKAVEKNIIIVATEQRFQKLYKRKYYNVYEVNEIKSIEY